MIGRCVRRRQRRDMREKRLNQIRQSCLIQYLRTS